MDFNKTIIPRALTASESITHEAAIDSKPIRARGIIVNYTEAYLLMPNVLRGGFKANKQSIQNNFNTAKRVSPDGI